MRHLGYVGVFACVSACLPGWTLSGPYQCAADNSCAPGYVCDDGLCCVPGASPACPTLPFSGACPGGVTPFTVFEDLDNDGYGNELVGSSRCAMPKLSHWVKQGGDCDDANAATNPGTTETCNGVDDNCNGELDDGLNRTAFFRDEDGDGYGRSEGQVQACAAPNGYAHRDGDCDDFSPARKPGVREQCNQLDDNCDGVTDEAPFSDAYNPGDAASVFECLSGKSGVCSAGNLQCVSGMGKVCVSRAQPGREVCDGLDNDCNGQVDDHPECGGPLSLTSPDVKVQVRNIARTVGAPLITSQCLNALTAASPADTWNAGTRRWSFAQVGDNNLHVLSFEPADGGVWDLSRNNLSLQLDLHTAWSPTFTSAGGAWSDSNNGGVRNPVVYLCGDQPDHFVRYVPPNGQYLQLNVADMSQTIPLTGSSAWIIGKGSGFDIANVRHVEVVLWPSAQAGTTNFTVDLGSASGFLQ